MAGKHGTRDGQPPATTTIAKSKLGGFVPAPPHQATSLSSHDNKQLGGEAPHYIELSISFPFVLLFLGFL
jgi:hypothetical protein